jgi:P-type Cu2+ transporter
MREDIPPGGMLGCVHTRRETSMSHHESHDHGTPGTEPHHDHDHRGDSHRAQHADHDQHSAHGQGHGDEGQEHAESAEHGGNNHAQHEHGGHDHAGHDHGKHAGHQHAEREHTGHEHGGRTATATDDSHAGHGDHAADAASVRHAAHSDHMDHSGHDKHAGHDPEAFRRKFWLSLALTIPIIVTSEMIMHWFGYTLDFPGIALVGPVLGTVVFFYGGWPFLEGAVREVRARAPGMMLLIATAITVAFVASAATSAGLFDLDFWWELAALVTIMLLGHWQEMKAIGQAQGALAALAALLPDQAERVDDDGTGVPEADRERVLHGRLPGLRARPAHGRRDPVQA